MNIMDRIFLCYPYKHESMFNRVLPLRKSAQPGLIWGGKHKFIGFYPKFMAYHIRLDACRFLKGDILLHVRVTHEDVWRQMLKNETNFKKLTSICCFTPKLCTQRGPFVFTNVYNYKYF